MEQWEWISGYENLYLISTKGEIKTFNWKNTGKESLLKPAIDHKGYQRVALMKDSKLVSYRVHRLVALTFIPKIEGKNLVNHIDGNKLNNSIENLEWVTPKENTAHAIEHGLFSFTNSEKSVNKIIKRGSLNGGSLLTEEKVLEIRSKFKKKIYTRKMLSIEYGVTENCIKDVIIRKSWKHI